MGTERQLVSSEKTCFDVEYKTLKDILKQVNDLIQTYGEDACVEKQDKKNYEILKKKYEGK